MYNKLILKQIIGFTQDVNENIVIKALEKSFMNAFSTFPYIFEDLNSKESIEQYNSGNCISLSLYIKNYLKQVYNLESFLIPASIPNKYKHHGYLDISHVAIAIPKSKYEFYIADSAFYFLNPILINTNQLNKTQIVYSKNIYMYEPNYNLKDYSSIEKIISSTSIYNESVKLNKYQIIPKNTYYSECYYNDDEFDKWKYYLIEICNPDEAISTFFINLKKDPFITTCFKDNNGVCKQKYFISLRKDSIKIEKYANKSEIINFNNLDKIKFNKIKYLEKKLFKYFKGNLMKYIFMMKNGYNKKIYSVKMS